MKIGVNRQVSIAPMMDCTDKHYRYLARLISPTTLLYTEMLTADAIIHGDQQKLLGFNTAEHPVVLQLGGSDPEKLAHAAKMGEQFGYDEINLNVGCPSDRVQAGRFGACLMKEPALVAKCVKAMQEAIAIPVTVKTRLGVDDLDSYELLSDFIQVVSAAGCKTFILHARKAWLKGLSPKENRNVPPLRYERVYALKKAFSDLEIIINGGIKTAEAVKDHLQHVDGVMIGREAYANPMLLAEIDGKAITHEFQLAIVKAYMPYVEKQLSNGEKLRPLLRPLVGLFQGKYGARRWRRYLAENSSNALLGVKVVKNALGVIV